MFFWLLVGAGFVGTIVYAAYVIADECGLLPRDGDDYAE